MEINRILVVILSKKKSSVMDGMPFVIKDILFSYLSIPQVGYLLTFSNSLMSVENSDVI